MKSKLQLIQVSRAIAIISVFLFHFGKTTKTYFNSEAIGLSFGWAGVGLFFVLSGFIITYIHFDDIVNKGSVRSFLRKRFLRIYPLYWLILMFTIAVVVIVMKGSAHASDDGKILSFSSFNDWIYVLKNITLFPVNPYLVGVAWSLTFELAFYLIFALCILGGLKFVKFLFPIWITTILLLEFLGIKLSLEMRILFDPVILQFLMGCLIAYIYKYYYEKIKWYQIIVASCISGVATIWYLEINGYFKEWTFEVGLIVGLISSIIILSSLKIERDFKFNAPKILVLIGNASYSIYLTHTIFFVVTCKISQTLIKIYNINLSNFSLTLLFILMAVVSLILGILTYRIIEKPLSRILSKHK